MGRGGDLVRARFRRLVAEHSLRSTVRANGSLCLDHCELGVSIVVYPEGVWYKGVRLEDVDEIFQKHILGNEPVERLRMTEDDRAWLRACRETGRVLHPRPVPYEENGPFGET